MHFFYIKGRMNYFWEPVLELRTQCVRNPIKIVRNISIEKNFKIHETYENENKEHN